MTEPSDPTPREAKARGGRFTYTDEGEGPTLVLVHGLPGSHRDFRWLAPHLSALRVLRIDQPGFGGTPHATEPSISPEERAAFLADALTVVGVERFAVAGHSFGGLLAAELAAALPERAMGLGLLASVGTREHRARRAFGPWTSLSLALRVPFAPRALLPRIRAAFEAAGFPRSLTDDDLIHTVHRVAAADFRRHRHKLAEVRCSTLVAWCHDDPVVEASIAEDLAARCAPGPRIEFQEGGHNLQKTQAEALGAALTEWVLSLADS